MCWEDIKIGRKTNFKVQSRSVTAGAGADAQELVGRRANRVHLRIGLDNGNCWLRLGGAVGGLDVAYIFGTFNQKEWDLRTDGSIVTEAFFAWSPTPPLTLYVVESWIEVEPPP